MTQEEETVVQQAVADAQQEESSQESSPSQESLSSKEDNQEKNWREMRQAMDELKRRNQALESEVSTIRDFRKVEEPPEEEFADDEISTVGLTKKLIQKEAARIAQETLRRREAETVEERIRLKFQDYDSVVTKENLESLFASAPELVKMLKNSQDDPYEQAIAAYKLMKQFGSHREESHKLKENQGKPRSVNSVGSSSALSQANAFSQGLTPQLRKQLLEEMREASKGA